MLFLRAGVFGQPRMAAFAWFLILLVSPVVFGVTSGLLSQRAIFRRLLARYGVYTVHPIPTAWDYVFSDSTGSWMLVTLADGSTVAGVFSARSFASSDAGERDLFLEQRYKVEDDGPWQPVPMNSGVWIRGDAIRAIEFWEFQE